MSADRPVVRDSTVTDPAGTDAATLAGRRPGARLPRTRAGTAWVLACVAAVALLALIVFITQNLHLVEVSFLGWHGRFPLVVSLLAGALTGSVLTLVLGSTRILQLRRTAVAARRGRRTNEPHGRAAGTSRTTERTP